MSSPIRHLLSSADLTSEEVHGILTLAARLRAGTGKRNGLQHTGSARAFAR